jgi:sulfide:quinone oxidoreductase
MTMNVRKLSDDYAVAGQLSPADVEAVAKAGFRAIICNRPDGEGFFQPPYSEIAGAAARAGLACRYLPITHAGITAADLQAFREALKVLPPPVLAYCTSGARSARLWSAAREDV